MADHLLQYNKQTNNEPTKLTCDANVLAENTPDDSRSPVTKQQGTNKLATNPKN